MVKPNARLAFEAPQAGAHLFHSRVLTRGYFPTSRHSVCDPAQGHSAAKRATRGVDRKQTRGPLLGKTPPTLEAA